MGKLGPNLTKSCKVNFRDIEFSYFFSWILARIREKKIMKKTLFQTLNCIFTYAFELGTFFVGYTVYVCLKLSLTHNKRQNMKL